MTLIVHIVSSSYLKWYWFVESFVLLILAWHYDEQMLQYDSTNGNLGDTRSSLFYYPLRTGKWPTIAESSSHI